MCTDFVVLPVFNWFARFVSLMFGFVWSDFAALPCGWLNSVVLALYGLVLLFCLDAV